jgi:hypothetical protein
MKNIVIIQHEPLTKRTQKIFYINELLEAGFSIEYWDMSQYFFPGITLVDEVTEPYRFSVDSMEAILGKLQQIGIENTVFIVEVFDNWNNRRFFKLLKEYECFTIKFELYATAGITVGLMKKLIDEDFKGKVRMAKAFLSRRLYTAYQNINRFHSFDVEISSNPISDCLQKVFINHPDYEMARVNESSADLIGTKYAVFIDEYFPLHPDLKHFIKLQSDDEVVHTYLRLMCEFFDTIEQQFDIQVVIAAHPKSTYTSTDFGNRRVLKYVTGQLIKHAEFAMLHASTSAAYAALYYCPLLVCVTEGYRKKTLIMHEFAYAQSLIFKAPFIQVEQYINATIPTPYIDAEACDNYKYTYLTRPEIEMLENKDILVQYFKQL